MPGNRRCGPRLGPRPVLSSAAGAIRRSGIWNDMRDLPTHSPVALANGLDPDRLSALTADGLLAMDDGELFLEARHEEQLTFEDGRLKVAGREARAGFGFRGVAGERVGYASGDRLEEDGDPRRRRHGAGGQRAAMPGARTWHPGRPARRSTAPGDPIEAADRGRKLAVLERIEAYCRAQEPAVVSVTATPGRVASGGRDLPRRRRALRRPAPAGAAERQRGGRARRAARERRPWRRRPLRARPAARGGLVARRRRRGAAPGPAAAGGGAGTGRRDDRGAGRRLAGRDAARGGGPRARGRLQPQGHLGLRRPDGPARGRARASRWSTTAPCPSGAARSPSTTRARPRGRNVLIEDGILVGYMQDRQNARLMRMAPTGNGRRQSYAHTVMPRMTNTYMLAGSAAARGDHRRRRARPLRRVVRRRPGRHHLGPVRVPGDRGLPDRGRQGHRAGQGCDADRQRARGHAARHRGRRRPGARQRHRHLRQERPGRAGGRRPADGPDGADDRGRDGGQA